MDIGDINFDQANALAIISWHSYDSLNLIESIIDATRLGASAFSPSIVPGNLLELCWYQLILRVREL